jgi:hypothetical protein
VDVDARDQHAHAGGNLGRIALEAVLETGAAGTGELLLEGLAQAGVDERPQGRDIGAGAQELPPQFRPGEPAVGCVEAGEVEADGLPIAGRERLPLVDNYEYALYVLDPLDDPTLEDLARLLAGRAGEGDLAFAECALSFVQGAIRYAADPTGIEYPLYPLETLVDGRGDCEDTTILYVSLLRALGHPVSMAFVDTDEDDIPDHVLALVPVPSTYPGSVTCPEGTKKGFLTIAGGLYAVAETAVGPASGYIPLGCDPWGLVPEDIKDRWDF